MQQRLQPEVWKWLYVLRAAEMLRATISTANIAVLYCRTRLRLRPNLPFLPNMRWGRDIGKPVRTVTECHPYPVPGAPSVLHQKNPGPAAIPARCAEAAWRWNAPTWNASGGGCGWETNLSHIRFVGWNLEQKRPL